MRSNINEIGHDNVRKLKYHEVESSSLHMEDHIRQEKWVFSKIFDIVVRLFTEHIHWKANC